MVIQLGQINCFSLLPVPYDITNQEEPEPYAIRYQYLMAPYDKVPVPYDKVPVPYQVELPRYCPKLPCFKKINPKNHRATCSLQILRVQLS